MRKNGSNEQLSAFDKRCSLESLRCQEEEGEDHQTSDDEGNQEDLKILLNQKSSLSNANKLQSKDVNKEQLKMTNEA